MLLFFFIAITNLLIACAVSFLLTFLMNKHLIGGYWFSVIIALIGSFMGTVFGIFLESRSLNQAPIVNRFFLPVATSFLLLYLFIFLRERKKID